MSNSAKEYSNLIFLDKIIGLRAFGLIFYGVLPSILFLLGVSDVKFSHINESAQIIIIIPIILITLFIFLLIRTCLKGWYLTTDFLIIRSIVITTITLLISTIICGLSGILKNKYVLAIPYNLEECVDILKSEPTFESFLLAIAGLLIASPFFMTAVSKRFDLPALPSVKFAKLIPEIRGNMKLINSDMIWSECVSLEDDKLIDLAEKIKRSLNQAINLKMNSISQKSLELIYEDIINLINVLYEIKNSSNDMSKEIIWMIYFENQNLLSPDQIKRRESKNEMYISIERLKELELGD